jgi:hypothetical protein
MPWNRDIVAAIKEGRTASLRHPGQKEGQLSGGQIHKKLTDDGRLTACLDLVQLEAIYEEGIEFYREHFAGKKLCAWRSVKGDYVSILEEAGGFLVIRHEYLSHIFDDNFVTLRVI